MYVNDIRVSQWLSAELQGVDDSELANRLILKDQTKYFFNGDNAYLAINPPPQIRYRYIHPLLIKQVITYLTRLGCVHHNTPPPYKASYHS